MAGQVGPPGRKAACRRQVHTGSVAGDDMQEAMPEAACGCCVHAEALEGAEGPQGLPKGCEEHHQGILTCTFLLSHDVEGRTAGKASFARREVSLSLMYPILCILLYKDILNYDCATQVYNKTIACHPLLQLGETQRTIAIVAQKGAYAMSPADYSLPSLGCRLVMSWQSIAKF